jgi:hypothetical protein
MALANKNCRHSEWQVQCASRVQHLVEVRDVDLKADCPKTKYIIVLIMRSSIKSNVLERSVCVLSDMVSSPQGISI